MATPDEDPRPDRPIDYRNPTDDLPPAGRRTALFVSGAASGVAGPVLLGFGLAILSGLPRGFAYAVGVGFAVVAVVATAGGVYMLRPANRKWFLAAFLLALGVTAAIEGTCFVGLVGLH